MPVAESSIDVKRRRAEQHQLMRQVSVESEGRAISMVGPNLNTDPRLLQGATFKRAGDDVIISRSNPLNSFGVGGEETSADDLLHTDHNPSAYRELDDPSFQTPTKDDEERARERRLTATPIHVNKVSSNKLDALIAAVKTNDSDTVKNLTADMPLEILNGVTDQVCWGAMHWAAFLRANRALYVLIEAGAAHEVTDKRANTPLHWAAVSGNTEGIELLCDAGADYNAKNHLDATPLHLAARSKRVEAYEFLVAIGANSGATDKFGITAEFIAKKRGVITTVGENILQTPMPQLANVPKLIGAPPWLHPCMESAQAKRLLQNTPQGSFLVREWKPPNEFVLTVMYKGNISHHIIRQNDEGDWFIYAPSKPNAEGTGCKTLVSLIDMLRGPREGWPISIKLMNWPVQLRKAVTRPAAATDELQTHKVSIGLNWEDDQDNQMPSPEVMRESSTDADPNRPDRVNVNLPPFVPFERRESTSDENTDSSDRVNEGIETVQTTTTTTTTAVHITAPQNIPTVAQEKPTAAKMQSDSHTTNDSIGKVEGDDDDEVDMDDLFAQPEQDGTYGTVQNFHSSTVDEAQRRISSASHHHTEAGISNVYADVETDKADETTSHLLVSETVSDADFEEGSGMLDNAGTESYAKELKSEVKDSYIATPVHEKSDNNAYSMIDQASDDELDVDDCLQNSTDEGKNNAEDNAREFMQRMRKSRVDSISLKTDRNVQNFDRIINSSSNSEPSTNMNEVVYDANITTKESHDDSVLDNTEFSGYGYSMLTPNKKQAIAITIVRQPGDSFGLGLGGPASESDIAAKGSGFFINKITPNSPASKTRLRKGWQVLRVAGIDVNTLRFLKDVLPIVKDAGDELELIVVDDTELASAYGVDVASAAQKRRDAFEVTLEKAATDRSYGIKFGGPANATECDQLGPGLFISAVTPGTPADRDPQIVKNLQIVAINGTDMTKCASLKNDAYPVLMEVGSTMTLRLKINNNLAKTYNNHRNALKSRARTEST